MTSPAPRTLDEIKVITDPIQRATASVAYLVRLNDLKSQAIVVRDEALAAAPRDLTAPALAEATGATASVVKLARRFGGR